MNENHKKTIATIMFWVLIIIFMSAVGSSFIAFAYKDKKITIEQISVVANGLKVLDKNNQPLQKLAIKQPKTGLKPATGELEEITKIPYTVTSEVGSEGAYSSFYIKSDMPYRISIKNIKVSKGESERENIFVDLDDDKTESFSLEKDDVVLFESSESVSGEPQKHTMLIWLSSFTQNDLIGAKISFELNIEAINE